MGTTRAKNKLGWGLFALIFLLALTVRLFGLSQLYQQDEYKWALAANPVNHMARL